MEVVEPKRGNEVDDDEMKEYFEGTLRSKLTKSKSSPSQRRREESPYEWIGE